MAIYEKGGLFYVDGSDQSFPRIEEARVVNQQVKAGTEFGQGQKAVAEVAGSPEAKSAVAEATQAAMPSVAATALGMAIPGAGVGPMAARAGLQGIAEYAKQLSTGGEAPIQSGLQAAGESLGVESIMRGGGALVKGALNKAPGVAERLANSEIPVLKSIGQKFNVAPNSAGVKAAYDEFAKLGVGTPQGIPLDKSNQPLRNLFESMRFRKGGEQQKELLADLARTTQAPIRSFEDVDALLHKVNRTLEGAATPEEKRLIFQAKEAIWKDIDNAQVPTAQKAAYRKAVEAAKTNFARKELDTLVSDSLVGRVGQTSGVPVPKTKSLLEGLDDLATDTSWVKSIGGEKKVNQIREFIREIHVRTAKGSSEGSAVVLGGLGGLAGSAVAGPAGAAIGAASAVSAPGLISRLAEKPKMAKLFLYLLDNEKKPIPRQVATGLMNAIIAGSGVND